MDSEGQGWKDRALNRGDRIAELEAENGRLRAALAARDRMLDTIRATIVHRRQEAALYGDEAEWEGLSVALRIVDDLRNRF